MIDYELLGPVIARQGSWTADLRPKHQLLMAVLAMEAGRPVPRDSLIRVLWGGDEDRAPKNPDSALNQVVSELRGQLRAAPGHRGDDPLPARGDTYRLPLDPSQVDALRFRAKVAEARLAGDAAAATAWRAALLEWGPTARGLFGGQPFSGLRGAWAEGNRHELRREYRDARFECLWRDYEERRYEELAAECRRLADEPDALSDEKFLELWMVATYQAGHRIEVERIYRHAAETVTASLGVALSTRITKLAEVIRTEDPRLNGPGDLVELDQFRPAAGTRTIATDDRAKSRQGTAMSSDAPNITFNNSGNARVGMQVAGQVHAPVIHLGADSDETPDVAVQLADPAAAPEPDAGQDPGAAHRAADGTFQ